MDVRVDLMDVRVLRVRVGLTDVRVLRVRAGLLAVVVLLIKHVDVRVVGVGRRCSGCQSTRMSAFGLSEYGV